MPGSKKSPELNIAPVAIEKTSNAPSCLCNFLDFSGTGKYVKVVALLIEN
jgi:hypothetical protein